jgi:hypothetical protein
VQIFEMLGQDRAGAAFGLLDQAADLLVDELRRRLRDVLRLRDGPARGRAG